MTLLLDPDIRDWVVLPLFLIMVMAGWLRQAVGIYLSNAKVPQPAARTTACLQHVSRIRSGAAHYLPTDVWLERKEEFQQLCVSEIAVVKKRAPATEAADDDPLAAMGNPMSMMKGNMAFMVQNTIMMQGIQYFFSGFILLKVPFPLTVGFKSMFQRGLAESMPDLDSSYVSSVSWYFLVMYGLRSFFQLTANVSMEQRETEMHQRLHMGLTPPPPPGKNMDAEEQVKLLQKEADQLEIMLQQHRSNMDTVEKRLLGSRYPRRQRQGTGAENDLFGTTEFSNNDSNKKTKKKKGKKKTN